MNDFLTQTISQRAWGSTVSGKKRSSYRLLAIVSYKFVENRRIKFILTMKLLNREILVFILLVTKHKVIMWGISITCMCIPTGSGLYQDWIIIRTYMGRIYIEYIQESIYREYIWGILCFKDMTFTIRSGILMSLASVFWFSFFLFLIFLLRVFYVLLLFWNIKTVWVENMFYWDPG